MAKNQGVKTPTANKSGKAARPVAAAKPPVAPAAEAAPKKKVSPAQFVNEVRAEARRITWTSWKETWINSVLVFIMVVVTSIFFLVVDGSLSFLIQQVLRLAS